MSETKEPKEFKRYYKASELQQQTLSNIKNKEIFIKGDDCGFYTGDEFISFRKGYQTGIFSYKAEGKTQMTMQMCVHLSKKYGWKHAIWLSESGRKSEVIIDVILCFVGKDIDSISDAEILAGFQFMDEHFFLIEHEKSMLNIRDIFETVSEIETTEKVKITGVVIDNATTLAREKSKSSLMIHEYMNYLVTAINRTSLAKNYHTFILYHVGKPDALLECKTSKIKYKPCPSDFSIVGGQMTGFLSYQLFSVWRPCRTKDDYGIVNPMTGIPYEVNETVITVTKSKPKKVGKEGSFSLFFDSGKQQYYELVAGRKYFAGEYEQQQKLATPTNNMPTSKLF